MPISTRRILLGLACVLSLTLSVNAQFKGSEAPPEKLQVGYEAITDERAQEWLSILAGPGFEGRGTGQLGYTKAAHWVAGKVAEFGLDPMGDGNTYFQMLPMTRISVDASQSKLTGPRNLSIPFTKSIGLDRFTNVPEVAAGLAFVRLTGDAPKLEADAALRDKIILYTSDDKAAGRAQAVLVAQRPAAMFRIVDDEPKSGSQVQREGGRRRATSLSGTISRAAALDIINAAEGSKSWIQPGETTEVHHAVGDFKLQMRYREEAAAVPNVIAWQPGSDPDLRDEYVVIGAHLDHLGLQGGSVFPGADDNGSGSTALLSIARAISANPVKPKRSILFMWFAAEEIGLVGSAYYVDHPILPLEKMVCMLNVDMVGRNEEKGDEPASENIETVHLVGSQKGDLDLHQIILDANRYVNFTFEFDEESVFGRSDQANFFKKGTSVAFLFGGFHPDYHRPSDDVSKINFHKIASAAKLYFVTAHMAAEHGPFKLPPKPEEEKPKE